jgi:N-acetyl-gamma-glutamylphosphate reductase
MKEVGQSLAQRDFRGRKRLAFREGRRPFYTLAGRFHTRHLREQPAAGAKKSREEVLALFEDFYRPHPFTIVSRSTYFSLKQVVNTNKCLIQLEQVGHQLVVHSALDNLLKGASGQAVQNMNLLFGLEETAGLRLKANAF